jgi:hydroxymethylbilane synthase
MNPAPRLLRLGTRGSRLALAQSRQVADALALAHPGLELRLVPIDTRGDRDRTTPLQQVRDPAFFSAEIDIALQDGVVDFTVHSRKDLEGPRPHGIVTAAMPVRANPQDVVLFRPTVVEKLRHGETLTIGTSSVRRARHVERFLKRALPQLAGEPRLSCQPLRGPVDQRIQRLHADGDDALDGVVLALAGLERLWSDRDARTAVEAGLRGVRLMVLPLSECPTAPGQGALVVECRADDVDTREQLGALHDAGTAAAVAVEFAAAEQAPGAAFAEVGATAVSVARLGQLLFMRGTGNRVRDIQWSAPPEPGRDARPWDGTHWHQSCAYRPLDWLQPAPGSAVFVAHSRALSGNNQWLETQRVWVSGWPSWQRLSQSGQWVEGCADSLGFDAVRPLLTSKVLRLPALSEWSVLTRSGAEHTWHGSGVGRVLATYAMDDPDDHTRERLCNEAREATHFYWSSAEQFLALRHCLPDRAAHACGTGKTYDALLKLGVRPQPFPNRAAWQAWLN